MLAAFRAARQNNDRLKPRELILAQQCLAWGSLPKSGGFLDQPVGLMRTMTSTLNIYNAAKAFTRSDDWADFARRYPDDWDMVQKMIWLEEQQHVNDL